MTTTMSIPASPFRPGQRSRFITPLLADGLLDPDTVIPNDQLRRRILSHFWRDCCLPACFSRAPAPVVEVSAEHAPDSRGPQRLRAWWLLPDGIMEDDLGPYSERMRPFFGDVGRMGQLWPRYQFGVAADHPTTELQVELTIFAEPMVHRRQRVSFARENDQLRVIAWQPMPKTPER